eukprot:2807089-Pyramimonas_sp.AAC.1
MCIRDSLLLLLLLLLLLPSMRGPEMGHAQEGPFAGATSGAGPRGWPLHWPARLELGPLRPPAAA